MKLETVKKVAPWVIGVLVVLWIFFPGVVGISEGSHTGYVTSVEYNSNIIWGSNIVYFKTEAESSLEDTYCVNDEAVKAQLIEAQKNKDEVTISYKNDYIMWKWDCNGGWSIIHKVDVDL